MKNIRNTKLAGIVAGAALSIGAVGLIGSPASADQPIEFSYSFTFPSVNPCTNEPHEVTIEVDARLHLHQNNEVAHESRTGYTDDGYVMDHGVFSHGFNGNVHRDAFNDMWRNDDGSKFQARGVLVEREDGIIVDNFSLRCIGN